MNIVWKTIAGEGYDYVDTRLDKLISMLDTFVDLGASLLSGPLGLLPFLRYVPPFKYDFLNSKREMVKLRTFF